ncbi:MAG: ABC transporter ATP-binding protein [Acidobacteriaceae bacterium]
MSGDLLLRVQLDAAYAGRAVLHDLRLDLQRGEVLGLVGSSGAGKSTLVLSLLGLLPWRGGRVTGEVLLRGENLLQMPERQLRALRGRAVGFIPQSPMSALNPALSLERHFREAWRAHRSKAGEALQERMYTLLEEVQLPANRDFLGRRPAQISVGQAQRVLIALALLHEPALLVADEPTSALDPVTQTQIVELLLRLNRRHGVSLLYVSHDLVSVLGLCHRIAVLDAGTIVESLNVDELSCARHPATRRLLAALPVPPEVLLRYRSHSRQECYASTAAG